MTAPLVAARAVTAGRTAAAGGAARVAGTRPLPTRTNGHGAQLGAGPGTSAPGRTEPLPDNRSKNGNGSTSSSNGDKPSSNGDKPSSKKKSKPTVSMPKVRSVKVPRVNYSHPGAVKGEFLVGLALFLLAPLGNPDIKMNKGFARRLIAFVVLFMLLFPVANSRNPSVARIGPIFGGMVLLYLAVLAPSRGFIVNASDLLDKIVKKLQPH